MEQSIRFLSFGAGAIGTYIGGSLALHGYKVVFLETPQVIEELKNKGLRLEIQGQVQQIQKPLLASSLHEALDYGPLDVIIFAIKSYDTRSAIDSFVKTGVILPPILCLQNGIYNEPILSSAFGPEHVIAGSVTSAVGRRAAGDIILEKLRGVGIESNHTLSGAINDAFNQAGLNSCLYSSASSMKWSKLITNLPANASSAILNLTPAEIFSDFGLYKTEILQLREALQVMKAQNIPVTDLPGTPVKLFAFAIRSLPPRFSHLFLRNAIAGGRGGKMPSFHIDLYNKKGKSEVAYLNGAIADEAEKLGLFAPVNRFLSDTLIALTKDILPLNTYARNPNKFLADLNKQIKEVRSLNHAIK